MSDNMTKSPIEILKLRLAAGEISTEAFAELRALIDEPGPYEHQPSLGDMVVQVDNVALFERGIVFDGRALPLSEVVSVRGKRSSSSVNFVPIEKSSALSVRFASGEWIELEETRVLFAGSRHKKIALLLSALSRATFQQRLDSLAQRLSSTGSIELYHAYTSDFESVVLTKDCKLTTPSRSVDLKRARSAGVFGVGTEWRSLGLSRAYDPSEVAVCEDKGTFGYLPRKALRFHISAEDEDVACALLLWMAEPGNSLA